MANLSTYPIDEIDDKYQAWIHPIRAQILFFIFGQDGFLFEEFQGENEPKRNRERSRKNWRDKIN